MGNLHLNIFYTFLILFSIPTFILAQENYPIPNKSPFRLFYIQHSNNHNTFVYEANMKNKSIDIDNPIIEYRIVYTEEGTIKPLTGLQKRMAYGLSTTYLSPNLFKLYLAANKKIPLYLTLDSNFQPKVYVTVNNQKMYLDSLFVKLKNNHSVIHVEAEYILFRGKDYYTQKNITEKYFLEK